MRILGKLRFCIRTIILISFVSAFFVPPWTISAEEIKEVALDFDDVDIRLFIRVMSELTGKNFIIDNNVKGKVTVLSPKKLTIQQAYDVFQSVLSVNGFALVESEEAIKIVPSQNISGYPLPIVTGKVPRSEDQFITQIMTSQNKSEAVFFNRFDKDLDTFKFDLSKQFRQLHTFFSGNAAGASVADQSI